MRLKTFIFRDSFSINMGEVLDFLLSIQSKFTNLEKILGNLLREEELLEGNILVKSGFIIRRYSLRFNNINLSSLNELRLELENAKAIELEIQYNIRDVRKFLRALEKDYYAYNGKKLHFERIFTQYINNAFQMSRTAKARIDALIDILEKGMKLHEQSIGGQVERMIKSFEKMINQILRFIDLLRQLIDKVKKFEENTYYPSPRIYGRAMSKEEATITLRTKELAGSPKKAENELVGVFGYSEPVIDRLKSMSDDERKNFFGQIGVVQGDNILVFQTSLKPKVGPIPQSNGIKEYKFPKGTNIQILEAA